MPAYRMTLYGLAALLLGLVAVPLGAQEGALDLGAEPTFGDIDVEGGFEPDPFVTTVVSGGANDVSQMDLGEGCTGFAATSPDFRVTLSGTSTFIRIFFISEGDATLIVNDPSGNWLCNDDTVGVTPVIEVPDPEPGVYDIWVGSFSATEMLAGYLFVTELDSMPGAVQSDLLREGIGVAQTAETSAVTASDDTLNPEAAPTFVTVELDPGLADSFDEPYSTEIFPGGEIDVASLGLGEECVGMTTSAPDVTLELTDDFDQLSLFFVGESDTSLIVYAPDGNWYCNDDWEDGLHPLIDFENLPAGEYDIWVGNVASTDMTSGSLYFTESFEESPLTVGG